MSTVPPAAAMARPPAGPVGVSDYQSGVVPRAANVPGSGEALPRMIFGLTKAVETLVRVVPSAAAEADQISQLLQQILVKASGAGGKSPDQGGAY